MFLRVKSEIRHNGKIYKTGDILECSNEEGKELITAGCAEENRKPVEKVEKKIKSNKKRRKVKI